ncbi:HNH endonuclease [Streptomyces sp. MMS24-I31]|uniref:HNH endonuclease n=1 Tax=Streptomyces sp. MMS24-I31 TaxID=3351563 RepID=UPI003896DBB1
MAVSKRLRYEILRRDNHTCRYCGASAPDVPLRIDHVTPVALGGTDTADNLVTSCEPCNSGKSSSSPDATHVAAVSDDALRWATAMQQAADNLLEQEKPKLAYRSAFLAEWQRWGIGKGKDRKSLDLPADWKASIERFRVAGLPVQVWGDIVDTSMGNDKVLEANKFKYCCGIAWNQVTAMQEDARRILADKPQPTVQPAERTRELTSFHLYATWVWAWERVGPGSPSEIDARDFMQDVSEMLERGLSAHLELTEQAFLAGSDHATDPSTYLPDEFKTSEQLTAELPLTHEQYETGAGVLGLWASRWEEMSSDGGPTRRDEKEFLAQLTAAIRAGHDRDWILKAADLAGGFLSTDLSYYLPKPDVRGGGN